ncbi:MAG: hypothetical protein FJ143_06385, partial [Deltaproteobacteria bacterium]|nr:hypothetical protein [Deltaproteobacteria bacterium]
MVGQNRNPLGGVSCCAIRQSKIGNQESKIELEVPVAYRTVGKALPRIEGYGKVTGQTKYAADLPFEGLLWAKVLRASFAHARVVCIDTSKAKA